MIWLLKKLWPKRYRLIPNEDGSGWKMEQFTLFGGSRTKHAVFMQRFISPEQRDYFHCHRHRLMISIPFAMFREERRLPTGETYLKTHYPLVPYVMTAATVHRVDKWFFGFTVWIQLFNKFDWGFLDRIHGRFVPEQEHITDRVRSL